MNEEFKPLKSMDNKFGIAKNGSVKNFITNRVIKSYIGTDCYEHIVLCYKGKRYRKRVHRLMAEAYFNNAKYIDHIDNNKSNNNINNLRPISCKENTLKGIEHAKQFHTNVGWFKSLKVKTINKDTKQETTYDSLRKCEKGTNVDRHRIKTFLRNERPNYTKYDFELIEK